MEHASAVSDHIAAGDRRVPIDVLVVHCEAAGDPEREIVAATNAVAAIASAVRRRGQGSIVLVSSLAGRPATGDPRTALRATRAWLGYAAALRRRLRADGVSVAVVVPSRFAIRMAARLGEPDIAAAGADRIAELASRGSRRHGLIAVPGPATVVARVLRRLSARAREALGLLLPAVERIAEPADEAPLAGKSAIGD